MRLPTRVNVHLLGLTSSQHLSSVILSLFGCTAFKLIFPDHISNGYVDLSFQLSTGFRSIHPTQFIHCNLQRLSEGYKVDDRWNPLARFVKADQLLVDIRLLCELFLSVSSLLPVEQSVLLNYQDTVSNIPSYYTLVESLTQKEYSYPQNKNDQSSF